MKTIGGPLTTAITDETTYLCRVWTLTLANATVLRFTDLVQDIVVGGQTYLADPGITVSALAANTDGGQNATINVAFASSLISENTIRRGSLDSATFVLAAVHWPDPALGTITLFTGSVGDIDWHDRQACTINVRSALANKAGATSGEVYSRTCRANLGDVRCGYNLAANSTAFTVATVASGGQVITGAALIGAAVDWYKLGVVQWSTGANAGLVDEVAAYVTASGTITFALLPRFACIPGDTGIARPGCNKEAGTCKNKFSNLLNFRGEAFAPSPSLNPMATWQFPTKAELWNGGSS
jgi:uncharacterized phage protein (TIGR02218 family)